MNLVKLSTTLHNMLTFGEFLVVDEKYRFSVVINRTDLLDWARVKLWAAFLWPLTDVDKTIRLSTLVGATKVGDILRRETNNVSFIADDTLAHHN